MWRGDTVICWCRRFDEGRSGKVVFILFLGVKTSDLHQEQSATQNINNINVDFRLKASFVSIDVINKGFYHLFETEICFLATKYN